MRLNVLLVALTLLTTSACGGSAPLAPSEGPWQFSGTVSALDGGQTGRPIAGAVLTVVDGANVDSRTTTDAAGHYAFTNLESGKFSVAIDADGFVGVVPVVSLFRDVEANFALKQR